MSPDDFHRRVLHTIRRFSMFSHGEHIAIAVSGGADSVALFRTIHALRLIDDGKLTALHVNHKLRGAESDEDARFVQELAAGLGSFCKIAELPLSGHANHEQEAREQRYAWFRECLCEQPGKIATGHTRSDQAETVLFRFLRGSAAAGLASIRPVHNDGFVRPLLEIGREDARAYLHQIGQPWREDSSNQDLRFARNRIRLQLLPQLAEEWNPAIERTLAQTAEWALDEESYWAGILALLAAEHFRDAPRSALLCPVKVLALVPAAVSRRMIREAIRRVRGDLQGIDFNHVEAIRRLVDRPDGSGRIQIPGLDAMRSFDWVRFAAPDTYAGDRHFSVPATVPGDIFLPPADTRLMLQVEDADNLYNDGVDCLDGAQVSGPLVLRTWQPGDHYRPVGRSSDVKLKTLFQETRIPLWERRPWPVLAMDYGTQHLDGTRGLEREVIVWSRRFGVAADYAAGPDTLKRVAVFEHPAGKFASVSAKLESGTGSPTSIS